MKSVGGQGFETMTMPHSNALFQTALQLTPSRSAAEQIVRDVYNCAWKSFDANDKCADWRRRLFKILIQRTRHRSSKRDAFRRSYSTEEAHAALSQVPPALREIILLVDLSGVFLHRNG